MKKSIKKGFTLVELLVVIAIIAILSIVGIVGYVSFTNRARISNDTTIVTELNRVLQAEHVDKKPSTMQDVVDEIFDAGFDLTKLTPTAAKHDIVYDSRPNVDRFYLLNEQGKVVGGDKDGQSLDTPVENLWKVVQSYSDVVSEDPSFSYYLGKMKDAEPAAGVTVSSGIDVGSNAVSKIIYSHPTTDPADGREVVIRTNGGELVIDAPNDDIYHYGYAESVNVKSVATSSYYVVDAEVKFLEVAGGHIVLEEQSKVSTIHFTATGEGNAAKFVNEDGKKISLDISNVSSKSMPTFSRDAVKIEENGTYVAEVKSESTEYIWLFGQGIKEQMVVTTTEGAIASGGQLNDGVAIGAEDGSVAEQIANPAKRNEQGKLLDDHDNVIDLQEIDLSQASALDTTVVVEEVPSKEDVQTGATLFAGGTGSQSDPFLIIDYETFQNVSALFEEGYYYFKVKDGVETIDCHNWIPANLNGSFDGNDVKLTNLDATLFKMVGKEGNNTDLATWLQTDVTIANFTVDFKCEGSIDQAQGIARNVYGSNRTTFKNIKATGTMISGSNGAIFFCFTSGNDCGYNSEHTWATVPAALQQEIYITDCSVETTVYAPSNSVGIIGGHYCLIPSHLKVVVDNIDTIFTGNYYNKSGKYHLMYGASFGVSEGSTADPGERTCQKITEAVITKGNSNYTTTAVSNASYIKVYIAAQLDQSGTGLNGITMSLSELATIENVVSGSSYDVLPRFNSVNYSVRQSDFDAYVSNSTLFAKIGGNNAYDSGSIKLVVVQYSSGGQLLACKTLVIASKANSTANWTIK